MKDLADGYAAAICAAAEELAAEHAEISMRHAAVLQAAVEASKAAIDATAVEGQAALTRYNAAADAAHRSMTAAMAERAREFLGIKEPSLPEMPGQPGEDRPGTGDQNAANGADPDQRVSDRAPLG